MDHAIIIGCSAGGLQVLAQLLSELPASYAFPVIVIQHRANEHIFLLEEVLQTRCRIKIKQADEKERIVAGVVYIAPPGYHLLIENDLTFSLSSDVPVKHSMPSIDVSFESAAIVFEHKLVAIILTGASDDGAYGIRTVRKHGGITIAQDPSEAQFPYMPKAAIDTGAVRSVMSLKEIALVLKQKQFRSKHEKG
jgi:two-component system, chemotaxis family, protein-glutamate methylesterase/glutaminase